jgi:hypothetical protein
MIDYKNIARSDFMQFFRDDEKLNERTPDDRIEIFSTVLLGSTDIKKKLLDEVISDYCVSNLIVIDINEGKI